MTLQGFDFECLTLVQLERNLPKNVFRKCSKKELKFILMYDTKKVAFFRANKDPVPVNLQLHVMYQFQCPDVKQNILGKWIDVLNLG